MPVMTGRPPSLGARAAALWGVGGVVLMLGQAIVRLVPIALDGIRGLEGALPWLVLLGWVSLNAYAEGYRGFHLRFSPRVVARALHLLHHPTWLRALFAPLFCMSLFGASRRGITVAWCIVVFVTTLVLTMRWLPQPWRGIVDAGVVAGLGLGLLSIVVYAGRALAGRAPPIDADVAAGPAVTCGSGTPVA